MLSDNNKSIKIWSGKKAGAGGNRTGFTQVLDKQLNCSALSWVSLKHYIMSWTSNIWFPRHKLRQLCPYIDFMTIDSLSSELCSKKFFLKLIQVEHWWIFQLFRKMIDFKKIKFWQVVELVLLTRIHKQFWFVIFIHTDIHQ